MSERKVLNKYYPPDFDPSKIPRMKIPRNRTFSVRLMAPCNMRCTTCGEYIYKGKKFNARKEDVDEEDYLGIRIYRFYIKCTRCLAEISFKTDPLNTDYVIEAGATRNFQALKLAEEAAEREEREKKEEEASNPMKLLENRTQASKREMEALEALQELRELNQRQAKVDYENMLGKLQDTSRDILKRQEEEDEQFVKKVFGKGTTTSNISIKRLQDDSSDSEVEDDIPVKRLKETTENATDLLVSNGQHTEKKAVPEAPKAVWQRSVGGISTDRKKLAGLVKVKKAEDKPTKTEEESKTAAPAIGALGMIGGYSSSDNDSDT